MWYFVGKAEKEKKKKIKKKKYCLERWVILKLQSLWESSGEFVNIIYSGPHPIPTLREILGWSRKGTSC